MPLSRKRTNRKRPAPRTLARRRRRTAIVKRGLKKLKQVAALRTSSVASSGKLVAPGSLLRRSSKRYPHEVSVTTYYAASQDDVTTWSDHASGQYNASITPTEWTTGKRLPVTDPACQIKRRGLLPFVTEPPLNADHDGCIVENLNHVPWGYRPSGTYQQTYDDVKQECYPDFGATPDNYKDVTKYQADNWFPLYWTPNRGLFADGSHNHYGLRAPDVGTAGFTQQNPKLVQTNPDNAWPDSAFPRKYDASDKKVYPTDNMYGLSRGYSVYTLDAENENWRPGFVNTNVPDKTPSTLTHEDIFPTTLTSTQENQGRVVKQAHLPMTQIKGVPESASGSMSQSYMIPNTVFGGVDVNLTFRNYSLGNQVIEIKLVRCKKPLPYNVQMQTGQFARRYATDTGAYSQTALWQQHQKVKSTDGKTWSRQSFTMDKSTDPNAAPHIVNPHNDLFKQLANGRSIEQANWDVIWSTSRLMPGRKKGVKPLVFNCKKKLRLNYKRSSTMMRSTAGDTAFLSSNVKASFVDDPDKIYNNCFLVINYRQVQDYDIQFSENVTIDKGTDDSVPVSWTSNVDPCVVNLNDVKYKTMNRISIVGSTRKVYYCRDRINPSQQAIKTVAETVTRALETKRALENATQSSVDEDKLNEHVKAGMDLVETQVSGSTLASQTSVETKIQQLESLVNINAQDLALLGEIPSHTPSIQLLGAGGAAAVWASSDGSSPPLTFDAPLSSAFTATCTIADKAYNVTSVHGEVLFNSVSTDGSPVTQEHYAIDLDGNLVSPSGKIYINPNK